MTTKYIIKKVSASKPEVSYPDIDVDFGENPITGKNKGTVIEYLAKQYGEDYVAYVGNRLVYSAKSAIRDLATVYEIPASETFKCTKGYDDESSVIDNIRKNKGVADYFARHPEMKDKVDRLVGTLSSLGIHAGGVILSDKKRGYSVKDFCALQRTKEEGRVATLWTKNEVAELGFIKYDLLGLSAASIIHHTREILGLDPYGDAPEDIEVFRNIVLCLKHRNIFQFESQIGRKAFEDFMPMSVAELANATSVIRLIGAEAGRAVYDDYKYAVEEFQNGNETWWIDRLQDECAEEENAKTSESVLGDSYGILIFQEQLANLVKEFSGGEKTFTEGNHCRKILDKHKQIYGTLDDCQGDHDAIKRWHKAFMEILEEYFLPYLGKDGYDSPDEETQDFLACNLRSDNSLPLPRRGPIKWVISSSAYLFNKLHAIAYSINSYNMMWLKHFHPLEFWQASLTCEKNDQDKIRNYITALRGESPDLEILSPNVNSSDMDFLIENDAIRFGLSAIRGMKQAADEIIEFRGDVPYKSIDDFIQRNKKAQNKTTLLALLNVNAFSDFGTQHEVWKKLVKAGKDIDEPEGDEKSLAVRESKLLGVNISFQHPILKQVAFYLPLGSIDDGTNDVCALRVLKTMKKVTKNGKPYALHRVQCLNDNSTANLFDWLNRDLPEEYLIARVQNRNGFMQLLGPSGWSKNANFKPGEMSKKALKAIGKKA